MNLGKVLRDERSIEGKHFADCLPAVEETGCHIEEGSQTDESIVCLYLLGSGMSSIVAYFLYHAHVLFKLPVFVDESIYLWAFEHIVQGFVRGEGNVSHRQMVFYEPFQCLACIGGTLFGECLLKDFCLIAVCVELVEGRNLLCQLFDKVKILHCRFIFNCYCYIFVGKSLQIPGNIQSRLQLLFEPVLYAGSQQGFEILDGLLNLRFLSLDLLYALGKETLEREGWERNSN